MPIPRSLRGIPLVPPDRRAYDHPSRRVQQEEGRQRKKKARRHKEYLQEIGFLKYVASHEGTSSQEVYRALGINQFLGSTTRDVLEERKLIRMAKGLPGQGNLTRLFITPEGREYLPTLPTS